MIRHHTLEHRFVHNIPEVLEAGVLYVSVDFATAVHRCCCGCGEEVVTPFSPTDWSLTFDGDTVSLWPSIGNWLLPCRSHYVIRKGKVRDAGPWSDARVKAEQTRDHRAKAAYYGTDVEDRPAAPASLPPPEPTPGFWDQVRKVLGL